MGVCVSGLLVPEVLLLGYLFFEFPDVFLDLLYFDCLYHSVGDLEAAHEGVHGFDAGALVGFRVCDYGVQLGPELFEPVYVGSSLLVGVDASPSRCLVIRVWGTFNLQRCCATRRFLVSK